MKMVGRQGVGGRSNVSKCPKYWELTILLPFLILMRVASKVANVSR